MALERRPAVVAALGTAQTLAWASSYYLAAILAAPIAAELGIATPTVFAAFSGAMVVSAIVGPWAGRLIDRHGGRPVLVGTNLVFASGLAMLGLADSVVGMVAAWLLLGVGMGSGLYEAAFATLVRLYGQQSRAAITGITLIAGFASTVGWPLTAWMEAHFGWRGACFGWVFLHFVVGLPLNAWLPRAKHEPPASRTEAGGRIPASSPETVTPSAGPRNPVLTAALLATVFAAGWFTSTAMAAHFPRVVQAAGASLAVAIAVGAMI